MQLEKSEIEFVREYRQKHNHGLIENDNDLFLTLMSDVDTSETGEIEIGPHDSKSGRVEIVDIPLKKILDDFISIYQNGHDLEWPNSKTKELAQDFLKMHGLI